MKPLFLERVQLRPPLPLRSHVGQALRDANQRPIVPFDYLRSRPWSA